MLPSCFPLFLNAVGRAAMSMIEEVRRRSKIFRYVQLRRDEQ